MFGLRFRYNRIKPQRRTQRQFGNNH